MIEDSDEEDSDENESDEDDSDEDDSVKDESVKDESDDNDIVDNGSIPRSIKQLLWCRQRHVEKMTPYLDHLFVHANSTVDSDRSGDYDSVTTGEKRSFEDFLNAELDSSDQWKVFANDLVNEIEEYQGVLRRIKAFQRE